MGGLTVFIDEGGDSGVRDGLRFHHTRHEWFSVGAYVVRSDTVDLTVQVRDELMAAANVTQTPDLHYYKLKPDRRQQVCSLLGGKPARAFCLLSHKTNVRRSEEHTSELQSLMRIPYAVFCLKKKKKTQEQ